MERGVAEGMQRSMKVLSRAGGRHRPRTVLCTAGLATDNSICEAPSSAARRANYKTPRQRRICASSAPTSRVPRTVPSQPASQPHATQQLVLYYTAYLPIAHQGLLGWVVRSAAPPTRPPPSLPSHAKFSNPHKNPPASHACETFAFALPVLARLTSKELLSPGRRSVFPRPPRSHDPVPSPLQ